MAYVFVVIVLIVVVGVIGYAALRARSPRAQGRGDVDVTAIDVTPPAHPSTPVPGSAERRRWQEQP